MTSQTTDSVLMIRPVRFTGNLQTATSNHFQQLGSMDDSRAQQLAAQEFDGLVAQLKAADIQVEVLEDTPVPHTPDSIFPNNWFSTHADGSLVLYPMQAANRRLERRREVITRWRDRYQREAEIIDLTHFEEREEYLEGTGSLVLDRVHRIAYAALSPRTHRSALDEWARQMHYRIVAFDAADQGQAIYHTNVLLCVGTRFAVLCTEVIAPAQRATVLQSLQRTGHTVIEISSAQMHAFAGNMLELKGTQGSTRIALSQSAHDALTPAQRQQLQAAGGELVVAAIPTIERLGGGSVRCMLAELF